MKRVFACVLAIMLVLGIALPLNAAREGSPLASADQETRVIVQLMQNPVLVYETQLKERGTCTPQGLTTYANTLKQSLSNVISQAKSKGIDIKVEAQYTHSFFGFSAGIPFSQIAELEKLPGVKKVFPDLPIQLPKISYTVPQTGAPALWDMPEGYTGEGIIVSVIDTGIDYNHVFLGMGIGPENKVLGGKNFTQPLSPEDPPVDSTDPMDGNGHGTHVAGIIAADGSIVEGFEDFKGMAPDANLYAVKVLSDEGKGYSSWVIGGIEWSVNPDDGLARADVINMSLGASYLTSPGYPTAMAANAAAEAGVIVVASAGNEGQDFPTSSAPSTGSQVISVASYGYIQPAYISVGENEIWDVMPSDCPEPDELPHGIVCAGLGRYDEVAGINDFEGIDLTGKIALMQRGESAFTEKVQNAADQGAIAAIIFNNEPGLFGMAGEFVLPAYSISLENGAYILSCLNEDPLLQVTMGMLPAQDLMSDFSSAGPANDYSLKPDITAPGDSVVSTYPGNRLAGMGGTSMSSPHVAGGVALLKQIYGDQLSVEEYKALIMNTSFLLLDINDEKYPVTTQGAGVMDLNAAALSRGFALPGSLSLRLDGAENTITVRNLSDESVTYGIEFISDTLTAECPAEITVAAGATDNFVITFDLDELVEGAHEGYVVLTPTTEAVEGHSDRLSIPVYHYVGDHEDFFITDFEVPRLLKPEETFDIKFRLTQATTWVDVGVYDTAGNYLGYIPIAPSGMPAGIWTYHDMDLGLPPGHYIFELYAETTSWFATSHREVSVVEPVIRLSGSNRFGTAAAISQEGWETAGTVILARADDFADSLAGVGLSKKYNAPILLTNPVNLSAVTQAEIGRLGATNVIILGGIGAVSQEIEDQLVESGLTVERIGGKNRFETAALIAAKVIEEAPIDTAVIVYGHNFPDALAAAPWAAAAGYPILMVNTAAIPTATQDFLTENNIENTCVVGGTGVISAEVFDALPNATRVAGNNRYETSVQIASQGFDPYAVFIASGDSFSDALSLAALAAKYDGSLLLVKQNAIPASITDFLAKYKAKISYIFVAGGEAVISEDIEQALEYYMLP
ncbi:MAG TPA: hypothetical protein DDY38_11400 [Firmicutes bacterium]|jgi:minor extracellular serine protease Vpr|nr:hypothetical protein [Bacillota bacterium]